MRQTSPAATQCQTLHVRCRVVEQACLQTLNMLVTKILPQFEILKAAADRAEKFLDSLYAYPLGIRVRRNSQYKFAQMGVR